MKTHTHLLSLTWIASALLLLLTPPGCAASQHSADDGTSLRVTMIEFHKNLRWGRYEMASVHIDEAFRETFLGRYEEYGEDLHIVTLEVKKVELEDVDPDKKKAPAAESEETDEKTDKETVKPEDEPVELGDAYMKAIVTVEQQWYVEPDMTVNKDKFIEIWRRSRKGWTLAKRTKKEDPKEKDKRERMRRELEENPPELTPPSETPADSPTP